MAYDQPSAILALIIQATISIACVRNPMEEIGMTMNEDTVVYGDNQPPIRICGGVGTPSAVTTKIHGYQDRIALIIQATLGMVCVRNSME